MQSAIRVQTTVLPGHRIEISTPELPEGGTVDVIVLLNGQGGRRRILEYLDSLPRGPRSYATWEEMEDAFQGERDSWDR